MVDALASGVSVLTDVGVQVPPLAPNEAISKKSKMTVRRWRNW